MAEPRKVPFVTLSAFNAVAAAPSPVSEASKRRLDADTKPNGSLEPGLGAPEAAGSAKSPGLSETVRINITLADSTELRFPEFSYSELLKAQKSPPAVPQTRHPSNDEQPHKQEVEALARKFENKYGSGCRRKRMDRVQDLIDIGLGYDENDSFIDNSEAYDELVPASLTTKLGGFYINTGTLQFRNASDSESNGLGTPDTGRGDEESEVKKKRRRRRRDEAELEEKMKNNQLTKTGFCHSEKKRRKLMLASMLKRFTQEKKETCKLNATNSTQLLHADALIGDLTSDPAMISLLASANESKLQDLLNELDFSALDPDPLRKNGLVLAGAAGLRPVDGACVNQGVELACPPPLPEGLPAALVKRIEDLRAASRQFDEKGRKKFFTLDMNNILLDIELQVQEQSSSVHAAVYSHLEAFVPCSKEALLKRLKKLSLNIQDDCLRAPLLQLKLAVCRVMPGQTDRYNMDCMAKVAAKQQMEDGERNGSEDEEVDKPGKRVIGPRKKFIWDEKLRTLLCNLVRVKLRRYEQEKSSLSVEDYLKAFMENEVKPLWPKGWMQARTLFKESRIVHGHITDLVKKKIMSTPKPAKIKDLGWQLGLVPDLSPAPVSSHPFSETICLSDSLDEDLVPNSLDCIALTLLNNSTNGVNSAPSTSSPSPVVVKPHPHTVSPAPSSQASILKDVSSVQRRTDTPASKLSNTSTTTTPAVKLRPPPTTTPLQKPFGAIGIKSGQATPPVALIKNPSNKLCDGVVQQLSVNSLNPKSLQQVTMPPSPLLPLIQKKAPPTRHQQRFITPMQATITKSSQSSNSPIIKLTHRPPAQPTPSGSSHHPPAQPTPSGSSHRPPAQPTPSGSSHRPPAQPTPTGSCHRPPAQPTPSGSCHRPPAQTTPSGSCHRPPAQPTPSGSCHRPPAQTTPSGSCHRPPAQPTPSGSCHRPPAQPTLPGSSHRPPAQTTPPGSSHCPPVQTTLSGTSHRPLAQTISSGSSHRPPVQTKPFGSFHRPPAQTTSSGSSHRPPAQTTPSGSSPTKTTSSGSSHRPSAQATPPGPTHHYFAQTSPSSSIHHATAQTTPPGSAHRAPVQSTPPVLVHQSLAQMVPTGSAHHSSVSTPSPSSTAHHSSVSTPASGHSNHLPATNSHNMGPAHRSPASGSTHRPTVSTPPPSSSQRSSVQTPSSSAYRPSIPTPPPNLARRSPVATPPSVSSPALTPPIQYKSKSSGFKRSFSPAPVAPPHTSSFQNCNLTSSVAASHKQRQRVVGGANQSNMSSPNCASALGLPPLSDSALLNQVSSMPLGLGLFGSLVPVSLPFQLPLLNFAPPGAAAHTPSSGYTLTPKSNQSQGGDVKRK